MPEIADINGVAIANVAKVDAVTKANIANINDLTIPSGVSFTGLLDETYGSGATAAYSVRRLASATTVLIRVRRDTGGATGDDDEADVAYDSNNKLSLDSAISNASSGVTATTLGQFINVGTVGGTTYTNPDSLTVTASCTVDTWYDQAGSNDAIQNTHGNQPEIHDGTVNTDLNTDNGESALTFNGSKFPLSLTLDAGDCSVFMVGQYETTPSSKMMLSLGGSNPYWFHYMANVEYRVGYGPSTKVATRANSDQTQFLFSSIVGSTQGDFRTYVNNAQIGSAQTRRTGTLPNTNTGIGFWQTWGDHRGTIQEIVIYASDKSGNRTDISSNINGHFSIYT
jgi:hypothetical protein